MGVRDYNIDWLEKSIYIPAQSFQGQVTGAFISAGDPVFQEISTLGMSGVQIHTASDAIQTVVRMPYDIDRKHQIRFRVWWTKSSTDADVETATVLYSAIAAGGALVTPATALSTAVPAYTFGTTANCAEVTDFGIINRNTLADTSEFLGLLVSSTMTNASADEISLLGLEMRYSPRRTAGPRRNLLGAKRLRTGYPLGVQLAATTQEGL